MTRKKGPPSADQLPSPHKQKWEKPAMTRLRRKDLPVDLPEELPPKMRDALSLLAVDSSERVKAIAPNFA